MTLTSMRNIFFSSIRKAHWGLVLVSFFLPAIEGCNKKIIYPYRECLEPQLWLQTSIYLYPIVLAVLMWMVLSLKESTLRFRVSWAACYGLFLVISYVIYKAITEMPGWYTAVLIVFWGVIAFGLLRCRTDERVMDLIGFLLTGFALWLFPLAFVFRERILYGGWLYLYANSVVVLMYLWEFLLRPRGERT